MPPPRRSCSDLWAPNSRRLWPGEPIAERISPPTGKGEGGQARTAMELMNGSYRLILFSPTSRAGFRKIVRGEWVERKRPKRTPRDTSSATPSYLGPPEKRKGGRKPWCRVLRFRPDDNGGGASTNHRPRLSARSGSCRYHPTPAMPRSSSSSTRGSRTPRGARATDKQQCSSESLLQVN